MSSKPIRPTVLIVGASRGLGLGLVSEFLRRGWDVVATQRGKASTPLQGVAAEAGDRVQIEQLEMTSQDEITALRARLAGRRIDLLFVNAGVSNGPGETIASVSIEAFNHVMVTNALSPMRVVETLQDLVPQTGAIAVMSSILGSVSGNEHGGWEVYRASKAALNTLMRSFAARHAADPRSLTLVHPGWVRTDMGGAGADLSIDESVPGIVTMLESRSGKPGLRYIDYRGQTVPW